MRIWPGPEGTMKKPVVGNFAVNIVTVYGTEISAYQSNEDVDECIGDSGSVSALLSFVLSDYGCHRDDFVAFVTSSL